MFINSIKIFYTRLVFCDDSKNYFNWVCGVSMKGGGAAYTEGGGS